MIFSENALEGRVALITGGATGIGFGIAKAYAACGAKLVIASRNMEKLQEAKSALEEDGAEVLVVQMDVRDFDAVTNVVSEAVAHFGSLDIVIANAAGNFVVPAEEMSPNAWKAVIDIDLNGTFFCAKAAFEQLRQSRYGGRFIAISTTRALEGWPGCAHAGAAKAGIMSLSRTLANEWGQHGIRCNTIAPGAIGDTEGVKRIYESQGAGEKQLAMIPLGEFGKTSDIASAAIYLASDAGAYVTGADLVVDGGRNRSHAGTGVTKKP